MFKEVKGLERFKKSKREVTGQKGLMEIKENQGLDMKGVQKATEGTELSRRISLTTVPKSQAGVEHSFHADAAARNLFPGPGPAQ